MDPDRRNRVCDVYHRALGRRPEERSRPCSGTSHHSPIVWRAGRCPSPTLTRSRTTVLDFGLTMTIWTVSGPSVLLTRSTVRRTAGFLGTPAHLNPERTRGQAVDGRTDTWALEIGSVWTELLRRRQLRPRAPATVVDCRNAAPPRTCCALYNEARGSRRRSLRRRHTAARDEIPGTLVRCTVPLLQRTRTGRRRASTPPSSPSLECGATLKAYAAPFAAWRSPPASPARARPARGSARGRRSRPDRRSESSAAADPGPCAACRVCCETR
jgi:hypothetical protein